MLDYAVFDVTSRCRIMLDGAVSVARQVHKFTRTRGMRSQTICTPNELRAGGQAAVCRSARRAIPERHVGDSTPKAHGDVLTGVVLIEDGGQRGGRVDGLAVDRGDHVPGCEPCTGGGTGRNDLPDHGARTTGGVVDTDTEECRRTDVHRRGAAALNLAGDGHRLVDRDR